MPNPRPLQAGLTYHIYNRGTNGEDLFRTDGQFEYFPALYARHITPYCQTLAYCLMPNHLHLAIRVRETPGPARDGVEDRSASQALSNLFNAYAKSINLSSKRTGSLFEHPFHRKSILTRASLARVIRYVHLNPQRHEFVHDFRTWPWSSYPKLICAEQTWLSRDATLDAFGGAKVFEAEHLLEASAQPTNL